MSACGRDLLDNIPRCLQANAFVIGQHGYIPPLVEVAIPENQAETVRPIRSLIERDIVRRCEQALRELNRPSVWRRLLHLGPRRTYERVGHDWLVQLLVVPETQSGYLEVRARFSEEDDSGTVTVIDTGRHRVETRTVTGPRSGVLAGAALLIIECEDSSGVHSVEVDKPLFSVGRGGGGAEVDVPVQAGSEVSRQHCHVRVDQNGAEIKDISKNGTWLNGVALPKNNWTPLPFRAKVNLGGAATLSIRRAS